MHDVSAEPIETVGSRADRSRCPESRERSDHAASEKYARSRGRDSSASECAERRVIQFLPTKYPAVAPAMGATISPGPVSVLTPRTQPVSEELP